MLGDGLDSVEPTLSSSSIFLVVKLLLEDFDSPTKTKSANSPKIIACNTATVKICPKRKRQFEHLLSRRIMLFNRTVDEGCDVARSSARLISCLGDGKLT